MTATTKPIGPADDSAILGKLLRLRAQGAPRWLRLYVNNDTSTMFIRVACPADLAAWRTALVSAAEVTIERHPESGLDYHHIDFRGWQPHWTVIMTARVDYPATLPAAATALSVEPSPVVAAVSPSFRAKKAAHRAKLAVRHETSTPDVRPAVSL